MADAELLEMNEEQKRMLETENRNEGNTEDDDIEKEADGGRWSESDPAKWESNQAQRS